MKISKLRMGLKERVKNISMMILLGGDNREKLATRVPGRDIKKRVSPVLIAMAFFLVVGGCDGQAKKKKQVKKPNILLILADDLGYGDLGVYGQQKIETPNIDALAQNGMLFTQFYTGSPVCAPSRGILMTGKHSGHAYIRSNTAWGAHGEAGNFTETSYNPELEGELPLPDSAATLGEMLQTVGYTTAFTGKWGIGGPLTAGRPTNQGFDFFYGYLDQAQAHTYYPLYLWKNGKKVWLDNELVVPWKTDLPEGADPMDPASYTKFRQEDYSAALIFEAAMKFIERNKDNNFFLYYAPTLPHVALQAPKRWVQYYHKKFGPEEPYTGDEGYFPSRYPHATYAAMVSYLDEQVGKLVEKLKELGEYKNTLIIFTSDNGPTYNGGTDTPWFNSAGPFKGKRGWAKGFLHEGGIRVPMIVSWPGVIKQDSKTNLLSAIWDIMPTLAEITDATVPENTDGISFLATLKGKENNQREHDYLYWEFPAYGGQQAVRLGKWKGIRFNISEGNMEIALFNLKKDIKELHDVSDKHPQIVKKMKKIMDREHEKPALDKFEMKALSKN